MISQALVSFLLIGALATSRAEAASCPAYSTFAIGSFVSAPDLVIGNKGDGVTLVRLSSTGIETVALHDIDFIGTNPNYIAKEGSLLHIINAADAPQGGLTTLSYSSEPPFITKRTIAFEAEHPAHVALAYPHSPTTPIILVANFKGDVAFSFMYGADGQLALADVFAVPELVDDPSDAKSRVHSAFPYRKGAILCDFGRDKVYHVALSPEGKFTTLQMIPFEYNDTPRHSAIHTPTDAVYVILERTQKLATLLLGPDGKLSVVQKFNILASGPVEGGTASAIRISRDNRFLYAGVRRDPAGGRIAAFPIKEDGTLGESIGEWWTGGIHPRDFYLAEDVRVDGECRSYVAVGNMETNTLVFIRRDPETGLLSSHDFKYPINGPTSILQI